MPSTIRVDGGLVTSKDATVLEDGELTVAENVYYKPNDPAVHKVRGRTPFNDDSVNRGINGCRFLEFDDDEDNLFVVYAGTRSSGRYDSAPAGATGTFSLLASDVSSSSRKEVPTLDSVHFNNKHYLLNGAGRNQQVDKDGNATFHGMLANTEAPTGPTNTGGGTRGITLATGSFIQYWVEERVKDGSTVVRRNGCTSDEVLTWDGDDTAAFKPVITRPVTPVNSDATHWALYGTGTNVSFPTGVFLGEAAIGTTTIEDVRTDDDSALLVADPSTPTSTQALKDSHPSYEIISVTVAGDTENRARNDPPPNAATGDIFEDSLVLNDTSLPRRVWYSWPSTPHAFPPVNYIDFQTKERDEVTLIRRVGKVLVVCLRDSIWRVNTLLRPEDAAFQTERVKEQIDGAFGCVGPMAGTSFSFGQGERLAYISYFGVCVTDGTDWDLITDDLDWDSSVELSMLNTAVLVNNPSKYRLELYVTSKGGTKNDIAFYIHYHPSHAKESPSGSFRAKLTGPIIVNGTCAMVATFSGDKVVFTGSSIGRLYQEDSGFVDRNGDNIAMNIKTKEYYIGGFGREIRARRVWTRHGGSDSERTVRFFLTTHEAEESAEQNNPVYELNITGDPGVAVCYDQAMGESINVNVQDVTAGDLSVSYFVVDEDELGIATETGRA